MDQEREDCLEGVSEGWGVVAAYVFAGERFIPFGVAVVCDWA